jgi:3',5'-cyclic AMP phosphodiesterase CpdA
VRIATLSDLHTDHVDNRDVFVKLAVAIHKRRADAVIVVGDVSHLNDRIVRTLQALREVAPVVAYLPGNHDLWFDVPMAAAVPELNTWNRYRIELRSLVEDLGVHYLPAAPLYLGDVAVVGSCAWYDGGFLLPEIREQLPKDALQTKQLGGSMWSDARHIAFRDDSGAIMSDSDVALQMAAELGEQLSQAQARPDVKSIVAATHHLAFDEAVMRTGSLPWEFFNAFMGSPKTGEVILKAKKVTHAVYGHTHRRARTEIEDRIVYGTPLGYPGERKGLSESETIKACIGWIDL